MTVHLIKLCVGADAIDDLAARVKERLVAFDKAPAGKAYIHVTRMHPRREKDLIDDGSIYWVIKGSVQARQRFLGIDDQIGADGIKRAAFFLDPKIILTEPAPKRAFQGWRYLPVEDAPRDLSDYDSGAPPGLSKELAELGLL
ncbi:MAG: DUF1489 domain-containing protein [Marinicaulis sp.]|nr:DUF1489 domain-containing protein [Marinicaulis sp.]NNE42531.1 DUF1489 domain-containing protein [Marinicaulis sp.]NNL88954.1 DUF1489 domain-containing protein [Marinicaulis sp.]